MCADPEYSLPRRLHARPVFARARTVFSGPVSICLENIKNGAQNTLLPCSACTAEFDHDGLLIAAFRSRARLENPGSGAA